MSRTRRLTLGIVAGLVAGAASVVTPIAAAQEAPTSSLPIVLPTGQQVVLTHNAGGYGIEVGPATQTLPGSRLVTYVTSDHAYAVPQAASAYLGRVLDPD